MHKTDLLVVVRYPEADMAELERHYTLHVLSDATDRAALLANVGPRIRAVATNGEAGVVTARPVHRPIARRTAGHHEQSQSQSMSSAGGLCAQSV